MAERLKLSSEQAAEALGRKPVTVAKLFRQGNIEGAREDGELPEASYRVLAKLWWAHAGRLWLKPQDQKRRGNKGEGTK